jgi:hypothetical protein
MDAERWRRVQELFHSALDREPQERQVFPDVSCSGDIDLRREVELLLAKEQEAESFLETPVMGYTAATRTITVNHLDQQFGSYCIVSVLGASGMEVYRAHDSKLGRDVALKTLPSEFGSDMERMAMTWMRSPEANRGQRSIW